MNDHIDGRFFKSSAANNSNEIVHNFQTQTSSFHRFAELTSQSCGSLELAESESEPATIEDQICVEHTCKIREPIADQDNASILEIQAGPASVTWITAALQESQIDFAESCWFTT